MTDPIDWKVIQLGAEMNWEIDHNIGIIRPRVNPTYREIFRRTIEELIARYNQDLAFHQRIDVLWQEILNRRVEGRAKKKNERRSSIWRRKP